MTRVAVQPRDAGPTLWPGLRVVAGYGAMILAAAAVFFLVRHVGDGLVAPAASARDVAARPPAPVADVLAHILVALAAVIAAGLVMAKVCARIGQPPVIGEVLAGIVLGPSVLGVRASALILPPEVAPTLAIVANLGVLLYMFLVGLGLDTGTFRARVHSTVAISHASIIVPFVLGNVLALALYPRFATADVPFTSFALFVGVAMSITAFPVLARILTDRGMSGTPLGTLALGCAAVDDVTAWCLLAIVVGVAQARLGQNLRVLGGALAYVAAMLGVVRPLVRRLVARWGTDAVPRDAMALVFVAVLLSALATDVVGIHAIFGAFLLGALVPRDAPVARMFTQHLEPVVTALLLPAFFALTGMRTRIQLVSGAAAWLACGLITLVATAGKFGGSFVAARLTGIPRREAAVLGMLMNTRGLMELIVLNIGLDLGVISPTLFAMLVVMAIATTMATSPVVEWLGGASSSAAGADPGRPAPRAAR